MPKVILVYGLPGSGKTTLANKISKKLSCTHLNADEVRERFGDWGFEVEDRLRQATRMRALANEDLGSFVVIDFVCPLREGRKIVDADYSIFMDTVKSSRYRNTNKMFEHPEPDELPSFWFKEFDSDSQAQQVVTQLITFDWRKPTVQMLGRWQPFHDGHLALFKRAFEKTGQVVIQVRDCEGWNDSNPFDFITVRAQIRKKLADHNFVEGREFMIMLVPNITNITYGRNVGYSIEQETFDRNIQNISATKIRQSMGYKS